MCEIIEENDGKVRVVLRDMVCYERDVEEVEREIEWINFGIC